MTFVGIHDKTATSTLGHFPLRLNEIDWQNALDCLAQCRQVEGASDGIVIVQMMRLIEMIVFSSPHSVAGPLTVQFGVATSLEHPDSWLSVLKGMVLALSVSTVQRH